MSYFVYCILSRIVDFSKDYTFDVLFPSLYVTGIYEIDGQILVLPIKGSGNLTANFSELKRLNYITIAYTYLKFNIVVKPSGKCRVTFDEVDRDGVGYIHIKKLEIRLAFKKGTIKLDNLFNGDKLLGDTVNQAINQNFNLLSEDILPLVEKSLVTTLKRIANRVVMNFTFDQLFPRT